MLRAMTATALLLLVAAPLAAQIAGRAEVRDGDSLRVEGLEIRLFGIDAPELDQECLRDDGTSYPCGEHAAAALRGLLRGDRAVCAPRGLDAAGTLIAVCRSLGEDLGRSMVRNGWALAYRKFAETYVGEESRARRERLGLWQGTFDPPWVWRTRALVERGTVADAEALLTDDHAFFFQEDLAGLYYKERLGIGALWAAVGAGLGTLGLLVAAVYAFRFSRSQVDAAARQTKAAALMHLIEGWYAEELRGPKERTRQFTEGVALAMRARAGAGRPVSGDPFAQELELLRRQRYHQYRLIVRVLEYFEIVGYMVRENYIGSKGSTS